MSRTIFLSMPEDEVAARCRSANVGISAVERLPQGGVRLVCMSMDGADIMRQKLKSRIIRGEVPRFAVRPAGPLW